MDKKDTRLSIHLSFEDHKEIKKRALFKNMTIKDWVMMAILKQVIEEKKFE